MNERNYRTKKIIRILGLILLASIFLSGCAGGYLFDSSSQDNSEIQQEYNEGRHQAETVDALGECALHPERCEDTQGESYGQGSTNPRPTKTAVLWTTKIPASTWGPEATQRHLSSQQTAQAQLQNLAPQNAATGCPEGCTTHIPGCDIKGNISVNTGEKIYHMPGDEFYDETIIRPEYGERWFCTKKEAEANGWRRTKR